MDRGECGKPSRGGGECGNAACTQECSTRCGRSRTAGYVKVAGAVEWGLLALRAAFSVSMPAKWSVFKDVK